MLTLEFGYASESGPREQNEDYGGYVTPDAALAATKGVLAVVADGVSGGHHGREAAETSVRTLLADFYATPETWENQQQIQNNGNTGNQRPRPGRRALGERHATTQ